MRKRAPGALLAFEQLVATRPADQLAAIHLSRLLAGQTGDLIVLDRK